MSFANMNPAERLKASGLIGVIVVILFFVVHIMMGAVAPKPGAAPGPTTTGAAGAPASAPVNMGTQPPAGVPFPTAQAASGRKRTSIEGAMALDIHDPFVPMEGAAKNANRREETDFPVKTGAPKVVVQPADGHDAPAGGKGSKEFTSFSHAAPATFGTLPNLSPSSSAAFITQPQPTREPDPEIRVIGVVRGDPSLATVEIGGQTRIARPGDPLARGWRLVSVDSEGIRIRHGLEVIPLRVGAVINESKTHAKE